MLDLLIIIVVFLFVGQIGFMVSKKIHKAKRMASKILDAYLPNDELMAHAKQIAANASIAPTGDGLKAIKTMIESDYDYITSVFRQLIEKMNYDEKLPPAAEWILDNYYIVERHIKEIKMVMDKNNLAGLPVVEEGAYKGYPRVYMIAEEYVSHRDARIEEETLVSFIESYQQIDMLTSSELWAIPLMIKVVLIENIAYICRKIRLSVKEYEYAKKYCDDIISKLDSTKLVEEKINRYFFNNSRINKIFVSQLISNLKSYGTRAILPLSLIDANLERRGLTASQIIDTEYNKHAAQQIAMGNSITGLVTLSAIDWSEIFELLSETEHLLREDPSGIYPMMDAQSRELYRKSVKDIAAKAHVTERAVVAKAFDLAKECDKDNPRMQNIGYYLIGEGKAILEQRVSGNRPRRRRLSFEGSVWIYILGILLLSLALASVLAFICLPLGAAATIGIGVLALIPVSEVVVKIINRRACAIKKVQILPKIEFAGGIGKENATFVIVPTLLFDKKNADELVGNLESFYLANRDDHLYFAIVGDFKDGAKQENEGEKELIQYTTQKIRDLNERYPGEHERFYLFCRRRIYNQNEKKWMGRERKRGAICDFVNLLKTGEPGDFTTMTGDVTSLPTIKYIITLDADTKLHQGTAARLIGTMAHPLNHAKIESGKVISGYGIMQPRVDIDLESANKTLFSKIFAGQGGIDPYSTAVSDVYQDLFGEGIFTGKGIFDVDAFYQTLLSAIADNTVLSHDLLEGSYLRCALLADVEVSDGYPAKYLSYMSRQHRWVRGDWQLLPWLFGKVKNRAQNKVKNPINTLSRWKIFDNLRRSLLSPTLFLMFVAAALIPSWHRFWVLAFAVFSLGFSLISAAVSALGSGYFNFMNQRYNATIIYGIKGALLEFMISLICLPYHAYMMADAIVRTLWRLCVSHKNMLEWVTAADAEKRSKNGFAHHYVKMWPAPLAGAMLLLVAGTATDVWPVVLSAVLAVLWILAPAVAWRISKPELEQKYQFSEKEIQQLRILARQTWRYFEDFATAADNYLPPDNFQEHPPNGLARRTSPTNIGMLLISYLAARDFGYLSTEAMAELITKTLDTIDKLSKWNGHLLNWYDTKTLEVMPPAYISTVDSGNFVGYLITLRSGLKNRIGKPSIDKQNLYGLIDTIWAAKNENPDIMLADQALLRLLDQDDFSCQDFEAAIDELLKSNFSQGGNWIYKIEGMARSLKEDLKNANEDEFTAKLDQRLCHIIERLTNIIDQTDFVPLFDKKRQLFSIGYNVTEEKLTNSYYDLLVSEARQASFIAIAMGQVSHKHWFKLGRSLAGADGYRGLVSWMGTMFEYLMPLLIMRNYKNSLLDETYWFAVREQIKYAKKNSKVWGISESGFFAFDLNLNYQYKAFGVPILGLKRGLGSEVVVAPYATALALMVNPAAAMDNLRHLQKLGMQGVYGMYEAVDFTAQRLAGDEQFAIVKSYMVHHQGMTLLALDNVINQNIMQKRFSEDPSIRSVEYLLSERVPTRVIFTSSTKYESQLPKPDKHKVYYCTRSIKNPSGYLPEAHILSNRSYSIVITDRGGGYSRCQGINVTRWRPDLLNQSYGSFIYVSQEGTNSWWSTAMNPTNVPNDSYRVLFSCDKAEFFRSDGQLDTHTEITVSAEDNAEIRRVTVTNHSRLEKSIALTSYAEIVLTDQSADEAHPAFSNLFIRTEFEEKHNALLANRRPRSKDESEVWAFHCVAVDGSMTAPISYETDRAKFIGRNNDPSCPAVMRPSQPLENSVGAVLDPIFSIRCRLKVPVGGSVSVSFVTGVARSREEAILLCSKYSNVGETLTAFEMSHTRMRLENKYFALKEGEEEEILGLLPHILYNSPIKEKYAKVYAKNRLSQNSLWAHGVSGDLPILLLQIENTDNISMVDRMLKVHEYFSLKGLPCDLVILCKQEASYTQPLLEAVKERVSVSYARYMLDQRGGVFVRSSAIMTDEEIDLFIKVARVVVDAGDVRLAGYVEAPRPEHTGHVARLQNQYENKELQIPDLEFFNGYGGFDKNSGEYVIVLKDSMSTPLPWSNVLANKDFGCVVTESGGGYSWQYNSRENRLTPWTNDPVSDKATECCYLKDTDTGEVFTVTSKPLRDDGAYMIRHGIGYTEYRHNALGIEATQTVFVPPDEPVKIVMLKLKNPTDKRRNFSATYVLRPILGTTLDWNRFIKTSYDGDVLYIENTYNSDFPDIAFLSCSEPQNNVTTDAREFVIESDGIPRELYDNALNGKVGAGFDSVCAMQTSYNIEPGDEKTIVFIFGQHHDQSEITKLAQKYKGTIAAQFSFERTLEFWQKLTGQIRIKTPDLSMDLMVNRWLLYQSVASRLFARSGFYQSGGAYGFRDQLQDVLSLLHTAPQLTREQILMHAAHQFVEGDVQHWWHKVKSNKSGADRGIRTKISDDVLWLVYVTCAYIEATEDTSILDEQIPYLESEPLDEQHDERYEVPAVSNERESLYGHCLRALKKALKTGERGLLLIGSGDWNDGMNMVGNKGKGESVWLSWFACDVLRKFIPICRQRGDDKLAAEYEAFVDELKRSIEESAWDGNWYRRAYFDDGTPLGSADNSECSIDAIAQAWAAISGAANPARVKTAMDSLDRYLVKREYGLITLLTPPFDSGDLQPGYIKNYVPGVRENGGQYTHAAIWSVMALAQMGDGNKAWEYFNMLCPINHARTPIEIMQYKTEPYVVCADVYTNPQHVGRGGWSWYTGSAGWFYKVAVEEILGIKRRKDKLFVEPCIPSKWKGFEFWYTFGSTSYHITVQNDEEICKGKSVYTSSDTDCSGGCITLLDDGKQHHIQVKIEKE